MLDKLLDWSQSLPQLPKILVFLVFIFGGIYTLIRGADIFVGGASKIAKKLKIPPVIIGLTIVSIGTSLPELSVSISSIITGSSDLSLGNIIGSNMFNIFVILGFSAIFTPIVLDKDIIKTDIPIMLLGTILLALFSIINFGNVNILSRIECGVFLVIFIIYIVISIKQGKVNQTNKINTKKGHVKIYKKAYDLRIKYRLPLYRVEKEKINILLNIILIIVGLVMVTISGEITVYGSKNLALQIGMSETLVGLTIVSFGTSLPELVTSIIAAKKGENSIAIGNAVGSNIFNILMIIGLSGVLMPLEVPTEALIDTIIMTVTLSIFALYSALSKKLSKKTGFIMLATYFAYFIYIILRNYLF